MGFICVFSLVKHLRIHKGIMQGKFIIVIIKNFEFGRKPIALVSNVLFFSVIKRGQKLCKLAFFSSDESKAV